MMSKILLVEDEQSMAEGIRDALEYHGFEVNNVRDAEKGEQLLDEKEFDLIILDVMLPGKDGFEMCLGIRKRGIKIPIIMLTARIEEVDKVAGFEAGADDYVTKPFSMREFITRVRVQLRRFANGEQNSREYTSGNI